MLYRRLLRPVLYRFDAERIHRAVFAGLRAWQAIPGANAALRSALDVADPALATEALGLRLANPVGLAAGFDKDAYAFEVLAALGFGFVEVGTLTAQAQVGNPKPRLFRLPDDSALINRLGFNNRGAEHAAARLDRPRHSIVGVNIGKTKVVANEDAIADYLRSTELLTPHADYLVVNVSSPNTPGLRDLQAVEHLRPLLAAVRARADEVRPAPRVPLLVKIAPDLADADIDAIADMAIDLALDGLIATNTTIARSGLRSPSAAIRACGAGGLSGEPLKQRSLAVLRRVRRRVGARLTLVSVGGIDSADEAWKRICAGATLIQLYTGFIYQGPLVARNIARGLAERARARGFDRVQDAVGCST